MILHIDNYFFREVTSIFSLTVFLHDLAEDVGDLGELVEDLRGDLVLVTQLTWPSLGPAVKLDRRVRIVIRGALVMRRMLIKSKIFARTVLFLSPDGRRGFPR